MNTYRLMLIGCSKTKNPVKPDITRTDWVTPEELYAGALFSKRVQHARERGLPWAALSAKYGVWEPNVVLKPYDQSFAEMTPADKVAWHVGVAGRIVSELWEPYNLGKADGPMLPRELTVEIHAGSDYCNPLAEILRAVGITVELPCEGLGIGQQLAFYTTKEQAVTA